MSKLSNRLIELCASHNITGAELCRAIGYKSKSLISELSSGRKQSITAETALRIANYFHVSVPYLLGETDKTEMSPANVDEGHSLHSNTIRLVGRDGSLEERKLTDEQIDIIRRMIDQMPDFED